MCNVPAKILDETYIANPARSGTLRAAKSSGEGQRNFSEQHSEKRQHGRNRARARIYRHTDIDTDSGPCCARTEPRVETRLLNYE